MPIPKRFKTIFLEFMSFFNGMTYDVMEDPAFYVTHLTTITDADIV